MAESSRIEDLRRRVQKDPASIAFAQLAEELRRAGQLDESIAICRTGLTLHPGYLSARVTLGRALLELNLLDDAQAELEHVLASAPENLAAIRGLADIAHRTGNLTGALGHYRAALGLAKNDPDLQETVQDLSKKIEPPLSSPLTDGLSLEQVTRELFLRHPAPPAADAASVDFFGMMPAAAAPALETEPAPAAAPSVDLPEPPAADLVAAPHVEPIAEAVATPAVDSLAPLSPLRDMIDLAPVEGDAGESAIAQAPAASGGEPLDSPQARTIAALEQWLEAIHVPRDPRGA
jgi:tetratricopeptide (TPR) repeat protein